MTDNPYESPAPVDAPHSDATGILKWPALGCAFSGFGILVAGVYSFWLFRTLGEKAKQDEFEFEANVLFDNAVVWTGLGMLATVVAYSLLRRRNRWTIVISSVIGILICMPAPLAVFILLLMRRKEIWETFDRIEEEEMPS